MSDKESQRRRRKSASSSSSSSSEDEEARMREEARRKRREGSSSSEDEGESETRKKAAEKRLAPPAVAEEEEEDSDDGFVGPSITDAAPEKKRRVLEYEAVFLDNLPMGMNYERSFMHRDLVTHVKVTPTDFVVTASQDGHIKFWKKMEVGVEFVKHFRAHMSVINDVAVNCTGALLATCGADKAVKVFDVVNFDMINILKLDFVPSCATWIHKAGDAIPELAVADGGSSVIHVYDGKGSSEPLRTLKIHSKPVACIGFSPQADIVISADEGGMVEYWTGGSSDYAFPKKVAFESKVETDLYEFCKNKTSVLNMTINHTGDKVVMTGGDRKIRIFRILTGKLITVIDESLSHYSELQQVKQVLPAMEFGKKISVEREIGRMGMAKFNNVIWDDSGNFIIYGSLLGIKMVNLTTRKVSRLLGQREHLRCLNVALFQGKVKSLAGTANTTEQEASDNPALIDQGTDPTLVATAFKKNRFYLFSDRSSKDTSGIDNERDVFNEKPSKEDIIAATEEKGAPRLYCEATIHTTVGDIHLELFPKECPKTVENFCVHARNAYFNGHIFHRVIKQFMIQTGDPLGTGTGGESIWGGEFEDEFSPKLRHDRPYTLSSANAGPNTNGSQFFITLVPTPWLDNKHTVFGRVIRGMEVVNTIGNAKTHPKSDKPYDDISMVSISVRNPMRWFMHRCLIATWMEALDLRLFSDVTNLTSPPIGMGPKPKGRLGRPHQQGTAGKRSPKKRAKQRKIEDEEDSDDETLGKGKLPARSQRESRNKYSLSTKVQAIQKMASGKMVSSVSDDMGIPVGMVSQWWLQRDDIRAAYEREVLRESGQDMVEEHIRMSQEDFDRKRMEKFLASNPDRPAMFQPHKRQHPTDPLSDDSVADPDEDFSAEEYMRKRKKATPSPSSEEDVGSWSMSFVGDKSPPLKAKHVAKNKIKDMPAVKDSQQKAISNLKIKELAPSTVKGRRPSNSPKKGGSGSSGRMMNQIKKIKKDQRKKRKGCKEGLGVKTSTYEVKETSPPVPAKVSKSPNIEVPGWRVVESPPRTISPIERALSPSPPPEKEVESGSSSLILQSPSRAQDPAWNSREPTVNHPDPIVSKVVNLPPGPNIIGQDFNSKISQVKVKTEMPASKSPPLKDPQPAGRNVKSEPADEYIESREADASSIASEDGNLMDFLEKVKKPENGELVDRYYSPFGLNTGEERHRQVNLKAEKVSPLKSVTMEQHEYPGDLSQEEDKGAVSPPRTDLLAAYPAIQLAPNNPPASSQITSPAVNALQRLPGLEVRPPSKDRRLSTEQLQFSQNKIRGSPLVRKPSIEAIGEVIAQPPVPVYQQPIIQRGRGRARGRARGGATLVRPMSPQVRTPMARGTLPPGVRMRMRGQQQPLRGIGRGETRPRMPTGQSPILGGRGRIVQRGQLHQIRGGGVLRSQPPAQMLAGRGRALLRGAARPHIVRGAGPQGAVQPTMRARHPGPRMISSNHGLRSAVASPRYQTPQPLAYNRAGAPQGPRYVQPGTRFASPRGAYSPAAPARGMMPQRGRAVRGQPMVRARSVAPPAQQVQPGQAAHPAQGRPGEAKRKVTVELSDSQLAALKSLGIM